MATVELTDRQITLARVALLQRLNRIKNNAVLADSYNDTLELLDLLYKARVQLHGCKEARESALEQGE